MHREREDVGSSVKMCAVPFPWCVQVHDRRSREPALALEYRMAMARR
jgi:hypothetical protein